jgi:P27 family predicted phage terminase small subunit
LARKAKTVKSVKDELLAKDQSDKRRLTKSVAEKRQANQEKLNTGADKIVAPRWISAETREIFYKVRDLLVDTEIITNSDVDLLTLYASTWVDFQTVSKELADSDYFDVQTGKPIPAAKEKRDLSIQLLKLGKELGLSPSARASLAISLDEPDEEEDEFES